jgi:transposase
MATATVLSGPERRRRWTEAEKVRIVEESLSGEASVAAVARRHDVHPNQLHRWRRQARSGAVVGAPGTAMVADGGGFSRVVVASDGGRPGASRSHAGADVALIEVVLRNGRVLRMRDDAAAVRVAALADALEGSGR